MGRKHEGFCDRDNAGGGSKSVSAATVCNIDILLLLLVPLPSPPPPPPTLPSATAGAVISVVHHAPGSLQRRPHAA